MSTLAPYFLLSRDSSSPVARLAHNQEVVGSNPSPATRFVCDRHKTDQRCMAHR